uniref:Ankyrin repeat and SOCS box containing 15b n=1 Tax=Amphilophus citrinellus TaxID=61819 RepID=A0A3Q0SI28_AMPCI
MFKGLKQPAIHNKTLLQVPSLKFIVKYSRNRARAIRLSGQSPVHSAADGGQVQCLELLIQRGYDVNALVNIIAENYGDLRKTPLYFAVSNGDVTCSELLLAAGARTDLDPLRCILVAIRAERYDLVQLLLSYGAEVNCYFRVISNTIFPTALQYCLKDHTMLRLLLNNGYHAYKCFQCGHGDSEELDSTWTELHNQAYQIYSQPKVISVRDSTGRHILLCYRLLANLTSSPCSFFF